MNSKGQVMIEYIIITSFLIVVVFVLNIYSKSNLFTKLNNKIDLLLKEIIETNFNRILKENYGMENNK